MAMPHDASELFRWLPTCQLKTASGTVALGLAAVVLTLAQPASAAVRRCVDFVAASGEDSASQSVAKQKALARWLAAAGKFGPAFGAWRLATDKSLSCLRLPDGTHRCQAFARPCGIAQDPNANPPGSAPRLSAPPKREQRI